MKITPEIKKQIAEKADYTCVCGSKNINVRLDNLTIACLCLDCKTAWTELVEEILAR